MLSLVSSVLKDEHDLRGKIVLAGMVPVTLGLGKLKQEACEFEVNLG